MRRQMRGQRRERVTGDRTIRHSQDLVSWSGPGRRRNRRTGAA
jgi:hypothetical protein